MPPELSEFLLLVSAVLVLAGLVGRRIARKRERSALVNIAALVLAAAGLALAGWVGWFNLAPRLAGTPPPPAAVVNSAA
jgi:CHASE2 domain-containing sensor protein